MLKAGIKQKGRDLFMRQDNLNSQLVRIREMQHCCLRQQRRSKLSCHWELYFHVAYCKPTF